MAKKIRKPTREEFQAVPWAGEGPDPLEDNKGVAPPPQSVRFSKRKRITTARGEFDVETLEDTATWFGPHLLPTRFRIEPRRDADGQQSRLPSLEVEVRDGRPRCVAMYARHADLTGPLMRDTAIESIVREAAWHIALTTKARKVAPRAWVLDRVPEAEINEALRRRGPGIPVSPEILEQVAAVWKQANVAGENTTQAVATALSCATSTANRWIARARQLDLIPPARRRQ